MSGELLAHRLAGERGEVVLTLNGGMMTHESWAPVTRGLLDAYRVLSCDFRGQLLSPGAGHRRLEDHVPDIVALLDALELAAVHVLGTSFGGEIGLLLAALHPDRVRTLAAVTAADRTPPGMAQDSRRLRDLVARTLAAGGDRSPLVTALTERIFSPRFRREQGAELIGRRERSAALPEPWFRGLDGILASIESFDLGPWLGRIACPTLVVHAAADEVMTEPRVRALAAGIAGAELAIHDTSGHALVAEDPGWLSRVYRDFLDRRSRG